MIYKSQKRIPSTKALTHKKAHIINIVVLLLLVRGCSAKVANTTPIPARQDKNNTTNKKNIPVLSFLIAFSSSKYVFAVKVVLCRLT